MKSITGIVFCLVLLISPVLVQAQTETLLYVGTVGTYETATNVLYSVILTSGSENLSQLTITSPIPEGMTFVEGVDMPAEAVLVGADNGLVTWEVAALEADTILGPFTYRLTLDETVTEVPANVAASVSWVEPEAASAEAALAEGVLELLELSGQIEVDARGTVNEAGENVPVMVENTGIEVFVPANAVAETVTLTFTKGEINDSTVPFVSDDTWWCAMVQITSEPQVEFAEPIAFSFPTRRPVTPGLQMVTFSQDANGEWLNTAPQSNLALLDAPTQQFGQFGGFCITQFGNSSCASSQPTFCQFNCSFGVLQSDRLRGTSTSLSGYIEQESLISAMSNPIDLASLVGK